MPLVFDLVPLIYGSAAMFSSHELINVSAAMFSGHEGWGGGEIMIQYNHQGHIFGDMSSFSYIQ